MLSGALGSFALSFMVRFAMSLIQDWQARQAAKASGRAEAVADGERAARASVIATREVEQTAAAAYRADATDGAFDQEFRRD